MSQVRCDLEATGPDGQPIVFWLIKQEDRDAVLGLLDAGYDIETAGGFGMTPLLQAALIDDWIMAATLLERGARADVAERRGFTVPYLSDRSRVDPDGRYGQALTRVRERFDRDGLAGPVPPEEVRRMQSAGEWPPAR